MWITSHRVRHYYMPHTIANNNIRPSAWPGACTDLNTQTKSCTLHSRSQLTACPEGSEQPHSCTFCMVKSAYAQKPAQRKPGLTGGVVKRPGAELPCRCAGLNAAYTAQQRHAATGSGVQKCMSMAKCQPQRCCMVQCLAVQLITVQNQPLTIGSTATAM